MSDSSGFGMTIASKAFAEAAGSLVDKSFRLLLLGTALGPIADIAAGTAAAVVKAIIEELSKQNSEMVKKLDKLIAEPLEFARASLMENLAITVGTKAEVEERQRQLKTAYDKLQQAYFYADERDPSARALIEFYRAVVAALMSGGRPYAKLYVHKLENVSILARAQAKITLAEANEIDPEWFERHRSELVGFPIDYTDHGYRHLAVDKNVDDARKKKLTLEQNAGELDKAADQLDAICRLINSLATQMG
jgi:hypothetical protein